MIYFIRTRIILILALTILAFNYACNNAPKSDHSDTDTGIPQDAKLKPGGLYLTKNKDGKYSVSKILAIDDFAVHVRMYADEFESKPTQLSSAKLNIMIGHAPMDAKAFLAENPELLATEDVKDAELEGYRMYLEGMKK